MADRVAVSTSQAHGTLSQENRNNILSALLSNGGINNIEQSLTHNLQRTGWLDNLANFVFELFRSGECTTIGEAMAKVKEKVQQDSAHKNTNGINGVNGVNGTNGSHADDDVNLNLAVPESAIREGSKAIRKELDKVCTVGSDT